MLYKDVGLNGGDKLKYGHKCVKKNWNNWLTTVCKYREDGRVFEKQDKQTKFKTLSPVLCREWWLDGVFQGEHLRILSVNYVTINEGWAKLPPQLS